MASAATYDAIKATLDAQWASTPIAFENEDYPLQNAPTHWVMVEVFGDYYDQVSIGAGDLKRNRWREEGQVYLNVMTYRGAGSRQARVYAEALVDIFRGKEIGGVVFQDTSIGAGDPGVADGNYWRMTAKLDWRRDKDV